MKDNIILIINYIIFFSFSLIFFFVPIILTTVNYELFEYNKMMLVYGLTIIIGIGWLVKLIISGRFIFRKSIFTIPLLLFLASQVISTIFTLDWYTSIWGYYSRFHGGLLSTLAYLILFFAFLNNFSKEKIKTLLLIMLSSCFLVSIYAVAEHFGIDSKYWVQDVQNRVFSTLGQPNWLAAFLAIMIPLSLGFGLNFRFDLLNSNKQSSRYKTINIVLSFIVFYVFPIVFYLALLFTKSRSGFVSLCPTYIVFWIIILIKFRRLYLKQFIFLSLLFLVTSMLAGIPYNISVLNNLPTQSAPSIINKPQLDTGITDSGEIRKIVWKGALDIFSHHPLIGTGVESFAYSYYLYRPIEHNLTSEWDFLYNKAHNEYLNFLANTGIIGFLTYIAIIFVYLYWSITKLFKKGLSLDSQFLLLSGILCGFLSILITNFFGFSVVIIGLFFYLLPAISYVLFISDNEMISSPTLKNNKNNIQSFSIKQKGVLALIIIVAIYLEFSLIKIWVADYYFAQGENSAKSGEIIASYDYLKTAVTLNSIIPLYHSELAYSSAQIAAIYYKNNDKNRVTELTKQAIKENELALSLAPNNVNFWKTSTKVYYELVTIDEQFIKNALNSLEKASSLSPTDPKIYYNLAILYGRLGDKELAIKTLQKAAFLKPNYKDAYYALALFYEQDGKIDKAKRHLEEILNKIDPNDQEVKKKLEELNKK